MTTGAVRWLVAVSTLAAIGCSKPQEHLTQQNAAHWLKDGMIAISRPVPATSELSSTSMLGFMPVKAAAVHIGPWISIDRQNKVLALMEGDKEISSLSGQGLENLKPGTFQILHKQRNALWYAPDSYFQVRGLDVPGQGDRSRYRRGALGDFVLYVDKNTPIHSGPIWNPEIGGVRLNDSDISKLYYSVEVGSAVEVR